MSDAKLQDAISLLNETIAEFRKEKTSRVHFAALAKAYEITFEYAWKYFKRQGDKAGLEIYSPRDALKAAAQLDLISDLELWETFLNTRNLSVHDYIGLDSKEHIEVIFSFAKEISKLRP